MIKPSEHTSFLIIMLSLGLLLTLIVWCFYLLLFKTKKQQRKNTVQQFINFSLLTTSKKSDDRPSKGKAEDRLLSLNEQEWLDKAYYIVTQYYADPHFTTSKAASILCVSERTLQRKFKTITNKSFMCYVIQYRLEKAQENLLKGQKVTDVAFSSGFNCPSYFSHRFKQYFGLSPSKFVENNLKYKL